MCRRRRKVRRPAPSAARWSARRASDRLADPLDVEAGIGERRGPILAELSHELRTPPGSILGWAKILRSGRVSEDHVREGLAVIERNAAAQVQIIKDLLDISRIVSANFRLEVAGQGPGRRRGGGRSATPAAMAKGGHQKMIDSLAGTYPTASARPTRARRGATADLGWASRL
nr:histidine kinase dimerization/phospho-acceptor domain-containing protein [Paludisphaera soli]